MEKPLLLLITSIFALVPDASRAQTPMDSLRLRITAIESVQVSAGSDHQLLKDRVDSLQQQLERHRYAEDFFDSALDEQANRFALIIGGFLTLFALISYGGFRSEVKRLEQKMRRSLGRHDSRATIAEQRVHAAEKRLHIISGNTNRLISEMYDTREDKARAMVHLFAAAGHQFAAYETVNDTPDEIARIRQIVVGLLRGVVFRLERLAGHDTQQVIRVINENRAAVDKGFETLLRAKDQEIADLAAQIRVGLRPYLLRSDAPPGSGTDVAG